MQVRAWERRACPSPQEADVGHCGPVPKVKICEICAKIKNKNLMVLTQQNTPSALFYSCLVGILFPVAF